MNHEEKIKALRYEAREQMARLNIEPQTTFLKQHHPFEQAYVSARLSQIGLNPEILKSEKAFAIQNWQTQTAINHNMTFGQTIGQSFDTHQQTELANAIALKGFSHRGLISSLPDMRLDPRHQEHLIPNPTQNASSPTDPIDGFIKAQPDLIRQMHQDAMHQTAKAFDKIGIKDQETVKQSALAMVAEGLSKGLKQFDDIYLNKGNLCAVGPGHASGLTELPLNTAIQTPFNDSISKIENLVQQLKVQDASESNHKPPVIKMSLID